MNKLITLGSLLLAFAGANIASAAKINGDIYFTGAGLLDGSPGSAEAIDFFPNVQIDEFISTGDYSGLNPATTATFTDFTFGSVGTVGALAVNPLWVFTDSNTGLTYSFSLTHITLNAFTGTQRLLEGRGVASISGGAYEDTEGFWSMSTSGTNATVSFSAFTSVPDGGTTAALMGLGLVAAGMVARRRRATV